MEISLFQESENCSYSSIILDIIDGGIVEGHDTVFASDYSPYGLQGKFEIFGKSKIGCFKNLQLNLSEKAKRLNLSNILIAFDENGHWCNRPIWKLSVRYQFLMKNK